MTPRQEFETAIYSYFQGALDEQEFVDVLNAYEKHVRQASAREQMERLSEIMRSHWLNEIKCLHVISSDTSTCACGWKSSIQPTVGDAVTRWFEHVQEVAGESFEREAGKQPVVTVSHGAPPGVGPTPWEKGTRRKS